MRPFALLLLALSVTGASASWFGSDTPQYNEWSAPELQKWLKEHNIAVPETSTPEQLKDLVQSNWDAASAWTADQYAGAQKAFGDLRDSSFEAWDESRLREFLLEQGVVAPKGPREQLVLLAKSQYASYTSAASSFSARASTAAYGDSTHQMTQSISSFAAQATREAARQIDDTKDYVYSTWDDNRLRAYLVEKGALAKDSAQKTRVEMLTLMRDSYASVATPVWEAWSESYMREWLIAHDIVPPNAPPPKTDVLKAKMAQYYYSVNDSVWSTWSDSDIKAWLVAHNIVKSEAQIQREKLVKLIQDNYTNAQDTLWDAWSDSQMREWLIEHGAAKVPAKRDELIKLMQAKYDGAASATSTGYFTWPDARLRAYLRNHGVDESALPTSRPGLLQEVRIRWVQTTTAFERLREMINSGIETTEDTITHIMELLKGDGDKAKGEAYKAKGEAYKAKGAARKGKENIKVEL
ncbi:hypothetical protein B0H15DRAFT_857617 [Mycena belliarum]|uniref:Uncharacterized protein n=1 Tax=Mycena belliarum TaxID=1033014 RepID=A0AAD6TUQ2_9AGAR|nr:hypothetical protein B0H15DRAFT_857617 [Mycena belliae]